MQHLPRRKSKKDKNAYGKLLDQLQQEKGCKESRKIRQALAAVESEKSPSGETYGTLFKEVAPLKISVFSYKDRCWPRGERPRPGFG